MRLKNFAKALILTALTSPVFAASPDSDHDEPEHKEHTHHEHSDAVDTKEEIKSEPSRPFINSMAQSKYKELILKLFEIEKDEVKKNNKILVNYDGGYASFNNETRWKLQSESILDELNVYLALSEDLMKNSNQNELSYNVIDEKGIQLISFVNDGTEMITIENEKLNSIRFLCPELKIHINVSKEYNYIPLIINRNSSGNKFKLILTKYIPS